MTRESKRHWGWCTASMIALVSLAGCGRGFAPAGVEIVVRRPPPERVEVRGAPPGAGYVWIRGHYAWQGGEYAWIGGRWEAPPEPRYRTWIPGHWASTRGGYYWVEGHWQ